MIHYTYLLVFQNGMMYHGLKSSESPHTDGYMGSGDYLPANRSKATKLVLTQHFTRQEASLEEIMFQAEHDVMDAANFYNQVNAIAEDKPVEVVSVDADPEVVVEQLGIQTVEILDVQLVPGTTFDKIWQKNKMQLIKTSAGMVIDNMVVNTYRAKGHDWTSIIGKKVKVSIYMGKHNKTVIKKMPFIKPI